MRCNHVWKSPRGSPSGMLRAVSAGRALDACRRLPPQQATGPANRRRPVQSVDRHRHGLQARAAVGHGAGSPYNELAVDVHDAPAAGIDDTSWRENRRKAQLWVVVTALTTVFTIAAKRSGAVAKALLGSKPNQVVTSDRHSSFEWIEPAWRQICWSHLERDFQAMIDRGGAGEATGRALLRPGQADVSLVAPRPRWDH